MVQCAKMNRKRKQPYMGPCWSPRRRNGNLRANEQRRCIIRRSIRRIRRVMKGRYRVKNATKAESFARASPLQALLAGAASELARLSVKSTTYVNGLGPGDASVAGCTSSGGTRATVQRRAMMLLRLTRRHSATQCTRQAYGALLLTRQWQRPNHGLLLDRQHDLGGCCKTEFTSIFSRPIVHRLILFLLTTGTFFMKSLYQVFKILV